MVKLDGDSVYLEGIRIGSIKDKETRRVIAEILPMLPPEDLMQFIVLKPSVTRCPTCGSTRFTLRWSSGQTTSAYCAECSTDLIIIDQVVRDKLGRTFTMVLNLITGEIVNARSESHKYHELDGQDRLHAVAKEA